MSFTVGLDFGTHQTKVCIENATNPAQKIYEFLEFKNTSSKTTVLFPSIVQINEDNTIEYGFIEDEKCKILFKEKAEKPELKLPSKPIIEIPEEPKKPKYPIKPQEQKNNNPISWKEQLRKLYNKQNHQKNLAFEKWEKECERLKEEYIASQNSWENRCQNLKHKNNEELQLWENEIEKLKKQYNIKLVEWKKNLKEKMNYRYFKLATFSNLKQWNHELRPETISIWYITYILFLLQEKLGEDFFVQLGVPSGINDIILSHQKKKAFSILVAAYKLMELYKRKDIFLSEKYTDLLEFTEVDYNYSDNDVNFYGLNVLPEAYAGLSSITQQKRLEKGMSLLVDIGGGTTDVAFFTITENHLPDIHSVLSFPKGLNFIFEKYIQYNEDLSIWDVQQMFVKDAEEKVLFKNGIIEYQNQLRNEVQKMKSSIINSFESRKEFHKLPSSGLNDALKNRPVVFCGGGSLYKVMRKSILNFTDKKLINKNLLNIPTILNQDIEVELFTILATSYGLSIPLENEIILTPIENRFNHIIKKHEPEQRNYKFEHGLTDL